ncbi:tRNA pseudouridine synthase [Rhynchospora pubera]|uniref:tRNA pseudouridine synthase n=1 Tax=Rhynchospora pubera TaxID=906938 RepID=A0AAV8FQL3_9POAL|nr:tRNA pseudouridine synthase [Rhynchospora pubera]
MSDERVEDRHPSPPKRQLSPSPDTTRPTKLPKSEPPRVPAEQSEAAMGQRNPGLQRYLVAVEYIGTRFSGSQKQPTCRTVVGALEEAFQKFIGQPVPVHCSSRTDAGVHALSNVCHVDVERISKRKLGEVLPPHDPGVVRRAVNHFLQKNEGDIMVTDVRCVPPDFHARFKALERTYHYRILSGPETLSAFEKDRAWHVPEDLDIEAMKRACSILVGHHDFSSFRAAGCQANSPMRTLDELAVTEMLPALYFPSIMERSSKKLLDLDACRSFSTSSDASDVKTVKSENGQEFGHRPRHRCFVVTARARSFLYHQVRLMVGVLKSVGIGDLTVSDGLIYLLLFSLYQVALMHVVSCPISGIIRAYIGIIKFAVEMILDAKTVTAASPMAPACGLYLGNVKYDLP